MMDYVRVTLNLPEDVVEQAEATGLLTDEQMAALLVSELKRKARLDRFFDDVDKLSALEPALTPEEIAAEIRASREDAE